MKLTPADVVIQIFGGVRKAARAIGRDPSAVSAWRRPRDRKGCDGEIPRAAQRAALQAAHAQGLTLTPADLIHGREVPQEAPCP